LGDLWKYPRLKKEFPGVRYNDMEGKKFKTVAGAKRFYKTRTDYKRRVNKPIIKVIVA
jgi:hypothetical protein